MSYFVFYADQLPWLGKRELICLQTLTCNYVVSVRRGFLFLGWAALLAHLSRRLVGELIVYPWSGVRPSSVVVVVRRRSQFQT